MSEPILEAVQSILKRDRPRYDYVVRIDDAGDIAVCMIRPAEYQAASSRVVRDGNRFARAFVEERLVRPAKTIAAVLDRKSVRRSDLTGDLVELVMAANAWMYEQLEAAE